NSHNNNSHNNNNKAENSLGQPLNEKNINDPINKHRNSQSIIYNINDEYNEKIKKNKKQDYSNYITYENFEKIVLSINDIKRQLLGTGDEIITSQIKYAFRSLSILCDDGIYRMNFECYKKALKCNEFLKLLGIHTKVADVFLQHELLKRKDKNKTKNGTMRNRKKYKNDSNRIANHLIIKSFSESTNTRGS
ncbi:hypothetical protein PFNF135_06179, partial [Plasmodium falciparum NF135/5.C10]